MTLARWQRSITDDAGNTLPGAQVTVRRETSGAPLAVLFSDRDGATPIGNPFAADGDGFAAFHTAGGAYRIDVTSGATSRTWRYVGIGLAAEADALTTGTGLRFAASTSDSDPGAGIFRLNNATLGSVTAVYIDNESNNGATITAWLDSFDNGGSALDRGTLQIEQSDGDAFFLARVTGSIVDGTGYRKVTVTPLATVGTFDPDAICSITFARAGTDGAVSGPGSAVSGNLASFADTSGDALADSGKSITTVGAGKHSVWLPKGSWKARSVGPSSGSFNAGSTDFDYWAFDNTVNEDITFTFAMPKSVDESAGISFRVYWMHPATVTNFATIWQMFAKAYSNDDAIDGASYTTIASVTDTGGTTSDLYISDESSSTAIGSLAEGDLVNLILRRNATDGSDNLAVDAYVIGVMLFINTNANTDA